MFSKAKVALSIAIVLGAAFPASAAAKHHRVAQGAGPAAVYGVAHAPSALYDMSPGSGDCSPVHPPLCSNICTGSGPCAGPDGW